MSDQKSNLDWAGMFQTMAMRMTSCTDEDKLYQQLRSFHDEFEDAYTAFVRHRARKHVRVLTDD